MGTLSKALGLSGGYLAASRTVIDWLINKARSFIYSTAPSPAIAHAASAALRFCIGDEGDARRARLQANLAALGRGALPSAIVPVIVGDEAAALQLSAQLLEEGWLIPAIRYPTVARGTARLRLTLSAAHEVAQAAAIARRLQGL
jgi:7-keto-8-aminopelargonate synthetase-like enzyme